MAKAGLPIKKAEGSKNPVPVKIVHDDAPPKVDKSYEEREKRYRAEDALRDIERAEGHKKNKELMRDVKKVAKEKINTMKKIC
ncbi:MAG: hypothetical protein KGI58_04085 [Patescibacteria group bacterium]|nr:hypothetical protein [Patescibacteria group bacterium]